jgi:Uma2 family endonuclease
MTATEQRTLVDELYRVEGKAEIIDNEIVLLPMTGGLPGYAALEIATSLRFYARRVKKGVGVTDGNGFLVDLPHRQSFSPDAAYHLHPPTMKFYDGAPVFAAEVRSEGDYGPAAERGMAAKRADYFAAGTLVVWDVDLLNEEEVIRVFRDGDPRHPAAIYRRGQLAEAEPAVPGWTMPVDDLFAETSRG